MPASTGSDDLPASTGSDDLPASTGSDDLPASTGRRLQVLLHLPQHPHLVFSEFLILHFIYKMSVGQKRKVQSFLFIDPLDVSI